MDLSKAFNTINHEFFLVKLYAYCFSKDAIKTIPKIWERINQKLLGVFVENDLSFDKFVITLYKTINLFKNS